MFLESAIGIVFVVAFAIAIAALAVLPIAFLWSLTYRTVLEPVLDKLPEPVKKVVKPLFTVPNFKFRLPWRQKAKRAR